MSPQPHYCRRRGRGLASRFERFLFKKRLRLRPVPKVFSLIETCAAVLLEMHPPMCPEDSAVPREGGTFLDIYSERVCFRFFPHLHPGRLETKTTYCGVIDPGERPENRPLPNVAWERPSCDERKSKRCTGASRRLCSLGKDAHGITGNFLFRIRYTYSYAGVFVLIGTNHPLLCSTFDGDVSCFTSSGHITPNTPRYHAPR